ncbi:MAG: hypothetical protein K0Q55_139 [Verrucomicrobia bacterium]|jgi:hypothetical protein|nr:hypothetical protein [Verrucomicrobiota bacterium]
MKRIALYTALSLSALTPLLTQAQDGNENLNRFSLGARFGMNFKSAFGNTALTPAPVFSSPGAPVGGINHTYDDGYNLVDSSGNIGGMTWNWGYQNASQVVGDTIQMNSLSTVSPVLPARDGATDDPQLSAELTYQRVIGFFGEGDAGRWGFEAGFGYTSLSLHDRRGANGLSTLITDTYQLNGVIPPFPGYGGTFAGPGPLLGDLPGRTTTVMVDSFSSSHELSGDLFTIRLGPFAEWYLTPKLSFAASVGITLAPAIVDYDFNEVTTTFGVTTAVSGHSSKTTLLYGPYISTTFRYDFTPNFGVYIGAQFQSLNSMEQTIGTRSGRLDASATFYATTGISWSF